MALPRTAAERQVVNGIASASAASGSQADRYAGRLGRRPVQAFACQSFGLASWIGLRGRLRLLLLQHRRRRMGFNRVGSGAVGMLRQSQIGHHKLFQGRADVGVCFLLRPCAHVGGFDPIIVPRGHDPPAFVL